jgi:hypothetical protein
LAGVSCHALELKLLPVFRLSTNMQGRDDLPAKLSEGFGQDSVGRCSRSDAVLKRIDLLGKV